jgi:hypothetical protein
MKNIKTNKPFLHHANNISKKISYLRTNLPILNPVNPDLHRVEPRQVNRQSENGRFTPKSGSFVSSKAQGEIQHESGGEEKILRMIERIPEIVWCNTQCIKFTYSGAEDEYSYYPDIICRLDNNQVLVIEVKPEEMMCHILNIRKYMAAKQQCAAFNWHYIVLSRSGRTIEDVANEHVPALIEQKFMREIVNRCTDGFKGVGLDFIKQLKEYYAVKDIEIASIALRNDLALADKPRRYIRLPRGLSWKQVLGTCSS